MFSIRKWIQTHLMKHEKPWKYILKCYFLALFLPLCADKENYSQQKWQLNIHNFSFIQ